MFLDGRARNFGFDRLLYIAIYTLNIVERKVRELSPYHLFILR